MEIKLLADSWADYFLAKDHGTLLNGDGLTMGWGENMLITSECVGGSCYNVAIGALSGNSARASRNIRFKSHKVRDGVTAALHAADVDGIIVDDIDIMRSSASINLSRCNAIFGDVRLKETTPIHLVDSDISIRALESDIRQAVEAFGNSTVSVGA